MNAAHVAGWIAIGCLIYAATVAGIIAWIDIATRVLFPDPPDETAIDVAVNESLGEMWRQVHADLKRPQP